MPKVIATAAVLCSLAATTAQAATVDFMGSNFDMGTVAIGQSGTITTGTHSANPDIHSLVYGYLPPMSKITFDYIFTSGGYDTLYPKWPTYEIVSPKSFAVLWYDKERTDAIVSGWVTDNYIEIAPPPSTYPVNLFASDTGYYQIGTASFITITANFIDPLHGRIIIANLSDKTSGFESWNNYNGAVQGYTAYEVATAVSPIPLPAALPLFGSVVLGFIGFVKRRGKADLPAVA